MPAYWRISRDALCADLSGMNPVCKQTFSSWKLNKSDDLLSLKKLNLPCWYTTRKRSFKTLYPPRLFPINCNISVRLTNRPRSIHKCWVLSINLLSIAGITLTTQIFAIYTEWTKMGLEKQQKFIQVTESRHRTGVQYDFLMGLAQSVRRHIAHQKLRFTCKSKTSQK